MVQRFQDPRADTHIIEGRGIDGTLINEQNWLKSRCADTLENRNRNPETCNPITGDQEHRGTCKDKLTKE